MSFLASILDQYCHSTIGTTASNTASIRHGTGQCDCGTVKYRLEVPYSSYAIVDDISTICHCQDCAQIPSMSTGGKKLLVESKTGSGGGGRSGSGVHLLPFYPSDVQLLQGHDSI